MMSEALEKLVFGKHTANDPTLTYHEESNKFYWVFYAGMGTADYHQATDWDSGYAHACVNFGKLKISTEKVKVSPNVYEGLKVIPHGPCR